MLFCLASVVFIKSYRTLSPFEKKKQVNTRDVHVVGVATVAESSYARQRFYLQNVIDNFV